MRLTCPTCGAQYEVPPEAIPPTGRDVQCSACGTTWFEQPAGAAPRLIDPDPSGREPWDEVPRAEDDEEEADDLADLDSAPPPAPRPRVTPEVAEILRSEAQREAEARAAEAAARRAAGPAAAVAAVAPVPASVGPLATPAKAAAPRPEEPLLGARTDESGPAPRPTRGATLSARELDLDRINSTLRSSPGPAVAPPAPATPRRRRSGFGAGFWSALLLLVLLAMAYAFAPRIAGAVPAAAPAVEAYVAVVDRARDWLDHRIGAFLAPEPPAEAPPAAP